MSKFLITQRNEVKQVPERANYEKSNIYTIIDEALCCHVGFADRGQPYVIPAIHARMEDNIILHGSKTSRLFTHITAGNEVCIAITLLDGLVLARSACHHSINYRSMILFGRGHAIETQHEKRAALKALMEHIMLGRWDDVRKPNQKELNATTVVSIPIEHASAKIRTGPPMDDPTDLDLPIWAGCLPIYQCNSPPEVDPYLETDIPVPEYIRRYKR
jgi:nitroimidazol reductase NimA-like FMN-containing flavoprotein (pyridoxamine 5'-phosphate oxidase superfamily)